MTLMTQIRGHCIDARPTHRRGQTARIGVICSAAAADAAVAATDATVMMMGQQAMAIAVLRATGMRSMRGAALVMRTVRVAVVLLIANCVWNEINDIVTVNCFADISNE